ncbi:MAG: hypothetical protein LBN39_05275, partial [Planctomycetaceae bacterium]|nr:hypothetical protein [Planctomycetaceae bacterium]
MNGFNYNAVMIFLFLFFLCGTFTLCAAEPGPVPLAGKDKELPGQLPRLHRSGGTIYRTVFDKSADALDGDGWPDYWTRKHGIDQEIPYPAHLELAITENRNPFGNYVLRFNIEGGGAAVFSPKIPVRQGMSYSVFAYVDANGLTFDDVYILAALYGDNSTEPLKTVVSEKIRNTNGWRRLSIEHIPAVQSGVKTISVGLLTTPNRRQDFGAKVNFTNIEIREAPDVALSVPQDFNLFYEPTGISVQCRIRGVDPEQQSLTFLLEDPFGRVIAKRTAEMIIGNKPASQFVVAKTDYWNVFQGTASWKDLPLKSPGFYRIRVATPETFIQKVSKNLPEGVFFQDPLRDADTLTFAVLPKGNYLPNGEFGWTLDNWTLTEIVSRQTLLSQSGLSRLKIPVRTAGENSQERKILNDFCDAMMRKEVGVVGLLLPVPESVRKEIKLGPVNAASVFSLPPKIWAEPLQPLLRDLSLLVRDWQWTSDGDVSITDIPNFAAHFETLRKSFDASDFGLETGYAQEWNNSLSQAAGVNFLALTSSVPQTAEELQTQLTAAAPYRRFVSLTPLSDDEYELEPRLTDLVRKMVAAKAGGAEAVFLSKPVDEHRGVLRENITPNELFLPWRTTASLLSGRPFLGSLHLPNHSTNYCFDNSGTTVMVLWNDKPTTETLYLGDDIQLIDVWGKRTTPERKGREQIIPVSAVPVFAAGLNTDIAKFRLNFQMKTEEISSIPNQPYPLEFSYKNESALPMSAEFSVIEPRPGHWLTAPAVVALPVNPNETGTGTFDLTLTGRANTGLRPIRFDVKAAAGGKTLNFAVYDDLQIGDKDLSMEFSSSLNRNGSIEVRQAFINNGDNDYTYITKLIIPDRAIQETRLVRQGFGRVEYIYTVPRG